mgnify:CR=1 FL=1
MLSQFQTFYLYKILSEMYHQSYLPYCNENVKSGGAWKREVSAKGKPIAPASEDREFIINVLNQVPNANAPKILMIYYQLLGHGIHQIRPQPKEPESKTNSTFAWINHKTEPDENGFIDVDFTMSGKAGKKYNAKAKVNIESLKQRLKEAGYDPNNQEALAGLLQTPYKTWTKRVETDDEAPEGAMYNFKIKPFGSDYHAKQVASSADFKKRMDTDREFSDAIAEAAVRAAANAAGIPVTVIKGFKYKANGKSNKKTGVSISDLDDAIQQAIQHLNSQSATNQDKLDDMDWVRRQLATGAMNHIQDITTRSKDRAIGDQGGEADMGDRADPSTLPNADEPEPFQGSIDPPERPAVEPDADDVKSSEPDFGDIKNLEAELGQIKNDLKDTRIKGDVRKQLLRRGMTIEDNLERARKLHADKHSMSSFLSRYNSKQKEPIVSRKPVPQELPDFTPGASGYSIDHDDDRASPEELMKYRRRMSAEGFTFDNYLKFKETMGATYAVYDGTKSPDFQWEGDPKSMRKVKKAKK